MYKKLRTLQDHDQKHALPDSVRAQMKEEFVAYMELHTPTASEISSVGATAKNSARRFAMLVPILCMLVIIGYASERALPQDPLYRIKTAVTEPILLGGAKISPDTYARAETLIVQRRLREAEQITAAHKPAPESVAVLTSAINERVLSIQKYAAASGRNEDLPDRLEIMSALENTLDSAAIVLQIVASSSDASATEFIRAIAVHGSSSATLGDQLEEALASGAPTETAAYAEALEDVFEERLETVNELLVDAADATPDPLLENAEMLREAAHMLHSSSTQHSADGDTREVIATLHDALEALDQAEMLIISEERLDEAVE